MVQDSTIYFLVVFTSHFAFEITLVLARVSSSVADDRVGADIIPANYSTLASYVSVWFEYHQ